MTLNLKVDKKFIVPKVFLKPFACYFLTIKQIVTCKLYHSEKNCKSSVNIFGTFIGPLKIGPKPNVHETFMYDVLDVIKVSKSKGVL